MRRIIMFLAILAVMAGVSIHAARQIEAVNTGVDDANIFFVYANNLIQGHGFVWNVGGERVEGFSSFLWVVLISPLFLFKERVGELIHALNLLLVSFAFWRLAWSLREDRGAGCGRACWWGLAAVVATLFVWAFLTPRYVVWTLLSKMETGLWSAALLVSVAVLLEARRDETGRGWRTEWSLAALMPVVLTARPEGTLWCAVLVGLFFLVKYTTGLPFLRAVKTTAVPLAAYALSMAGLFGFRLMYFNSLFPNTYYAKVSPDRAYTLEIGYEYFQGFLATGDHTRLFVRCAFVGLIVTAGLLARWGWMQFVRKRPLSLTPNALGLGVSSSAVFIGLLVPVLVGGDHFEWYRFYQPIWPLLVLPVYFLARVVFEWAGGVRRHPAGLQAAALALVLAAVWFFNAPKHSWDIADARIVQEFVLAEDGRRLGKLLHAVHEDLPRVGAIAVGGVQYAYEGPIVDLMGLNNVEMARHPGDRRGIKNHAAFSKEVFYRQRPDIMVPFIMEPDEALDKDGWRERVRFYVHHRWILQPLKGLTNDERFLDQYALAVVSRPDAQGRLWLLAYYRKDYLETIVQEGRHRLFVL